MTHRAQIVLSLHDWPGNVREIENVIGHACMMTMADTIDIPDLPVSLRSPKKAAATAAEASLPGLDDVGVGTLEDRERVLIVRALEESGGNQSQAAPSSASAATPCVTS